MAKNKSRKSSKKPDGQHGGIRQLFTNFAYTLNYFTMLLRFIVTVLNVLK